LGGSARVKAINIILFVLSWQCCFGDTNMSVIAISDWSKAVPGTGVGREYGGSLQGRLLIFEGYSPGYEGKVPETLVYLELRNVSVGGPLDIYYDFQNGLRADVKDINGKPPPVVGTGGSGGFPSASWVTLPYNSVVRLNASWGGYGMSKEKGLQIPLFYPIILLADNTNEYFLSCTLTATAPTNYVCPPDHHIWTGKLALPAVKVSGKR
jgi:hypothetical protein